MPPETTGLPISTLARPLERGTRPVLYLIDGYAQFFRAYHAIRTPMTSPVTKEPTNLTYGFFGMLLKLLRGTPATAGHPSHLAVALDVSSDTGTFRSQIDPQYKANRPPPPHDLPQQVERCLDSLRAIGVPLLGAAGFEADDVLATIVTQLRAAHPDVLIRIVSKDKDLKQLLIAGHVEMFDVHTDVLITRDTLHAELGIEPPQVIDMLALMGDNVDNVPGVEGIGPKTAAELVAQYSTAEGAIAAAVAGQVKGKRGEKLRQAGPIVETSRKLVTLRHDAPVTLALSDAATSSLNLRPLIDACKVLGFNRYQDEIRDLLGEGRASPATATPITPAEAAARSPVAIRPAAPDPFDFGGLFGAAAPAADQLVPSHDSPADASIFASDASLLPPAAHWPEPVAYHCVRTQNDLDALAAELATRSHFAFDTETTGLRPMRAELVGLSVCAVPGTAFYIPVRSPDSDSHLSVQQVLAALGPVLTNPVIAKCGHNTKFDLLVLRRAGVLAQGAAGTAPTAQRTATGAIPFDSMIASYLIDASRSSHSMDALALALLQHQNISISQLLGSGKMQRRFDEVPLGLATQYAAEDADVTLRLRNVMQPQLAAMGLLDLFCDVEMPLVGVLAELEHNGIRVDPAELDRQRARLELRLVDIHRELDTAAYSSVGYTFNPDSPKQLALALFGKPHDDPAGLGLKPVKKTKTGYSTDVEVLDQLADDPAISTPIPKLIVEHRQLSKLVGTYLVALKDEINPRTGRVHASFNQTVAATGRLSSSDPNLQNIPIRTEVGREIRRAFVAEPGHLLISADYSQIELRLLAHLSRDAALIDAFNNDQDIHAAVAAQVHNVPLDQVTPAMRSGAKMVNFGIVYGITGYGLGRRLGIGTGEAERIITDYKHRFPGITTFLQECVSQARAQGYVETMLKRRRPITEIDSPNPSRRALAERMAINSVVQGSAADLIKLAMVSLQQSITLGQSLPGLAMLLQIHDELVFECPTAHITAATAHIVNHMENAMQLCVPLTAAAASGPNWYEQ